MTSVVVSFLIPNTSLLGHLCALAIGYLCKSIETLDFPLVLIRFTRRSWLFENPRTTRESPSLDRGKAQFVGKTTTLRIGGPENLWEIWCPSIYHNARIK